MESEKMYRLLFKPSQHYVTIRNNKDFPSKIPTQRH